MRLVFLGPPGAGKGTQAKLLAEECALLHLSTGDMLRSAVERKTETGLLAKGYMDKGKLVPDEVVDALVAERLREDDTAGGYILDGYPRNLAQAEALARVLEKTPLDGVLFLAVADDELVQRLLQRGQGRADDTEDVIRKRLAVYKAHTSPLVDHYRKLALLREIDGHGSIGQVRLAVRASAEELVA